MSIYTSTMSKFAFANAIAANQIKNIDQKDPGLQLFINLAIASHSALKKWPGNSFSNHEMQVTVKKLKKFVDKVHWDYKPVHIQSMINFSLFQMVDLIENHIKDPERTELVYRIGTAEQLIYDAYSSEPDLERPQCITEGQLAALRWTEIMEG